MLELVSESSQVNQTTTLRWGEERAFRSSLLTGYMGLKTHALGPKHWLIWFSQYSMFWNDFLYVLGLNKQIHPSQWEAHSQVFHCQKLKQEKLARMNSCEVWCLMELKKKRFLHMCSKESQEGTGGGNNCLLGPKVLLYPIVSLEKTSLPSSFLPFRRVKASWPKHLKVSNSTLLART